MFLPSRKLRYCKIIVAASLFWVMLDSVSILLPKVPVAYENDFPEFSFIPNGPGEMGEAVVIPKEKEAESKEQFKINQFNLVASEMIALNRSLPDVRSDKCKTKKYNSKLPRTSIVIVFHNEAWSTLLRTVHSIINRSPLHLLEEIVLVDDASERDFLGKKLEDYVRKLPILVRMVRMGKRSGLIRARLKGAATSTGQVITFLDAHCECTKGWLEPLLYEIARDRSAVVCPIIEEISAETFEFFLESNMTYGGFNWKLDFRWYPVPKHEMDRRDGDQSIPLRTPTMSGGIFAIDRDYFEEIGTYDAGMDIWGGENLEISFRIWQCGGTLLIVACSHVGHVFRETSPYTFPGGAVQVINKNKRRLAEVWMDSYKDFFYIISPGILELEYGDISERMKLRERLHCKSFQWYLENIYRNSQVPSKYEALGEIRNQLTGMCLDTRGKTENHNVAIFNCHGMGGNQAWAYTGNKELRYDDLCLDVSGPSGPVIMVKCHGRMENQEWLYDKNTRLLRHAHTDMCLDKPIEFVSQLPSLSECDADSLSQKWTLKNLKVSDIR